MPKPNIPARIQAGRLMASVRDYRNGPAPGDRERAVIHGVTDKGVFVDEMTADRFLGRAGRILAESGRVYNYGNTIVYEATRDGDGSLRTLAIDGRAEAHAAHVLANLFVTASEARTGPAQSLPAPRLVQSLLADESLPRGLPTILYHARRPTFDLDFVLCRPGWNPGPGILVHGPEVVPAPWDPGDAPTTRAVDRLPPRLRALLKEFPWRSDADLANALGALLTGLLINHFIDDPHPAGIVDGNQPELGKTLLVESIGRVLDAEVPEKIPLRNDEEVEKRLCAQLRSSGTSLFFFDNVRARIESVVLEQNALSPNVTFRILGKSTTVKRPNTFLWMISSNQTAGTPDFISRAVPIRLYYEGDPRARRFEGDPSTFATGHRLEVLGELAGMVLRWLEQGRPPGAQRHRCRRWAGVIGGILDVAGLGGHFLANLAEAEAAMDQGLLELATLAEHVLGRGEAGLRVLPGEDSEGKGLAARSWVEVIDAAGVLREKLAEAANAKARETIVGTFLSGKVDRSVTIETAEGFRWATLRRSEGRSRAKHYHFGFGPVGGAAEDGVTGTTPPTLPGEEPARDAGPANGIGDDETPVTPGGTDEDGSGEPRWL